MFEAPAAAQRQAATGALHQRRRVAVLHRGQGADVLRGLVAALEAVTPGTAASVVVHGPSKAMVVNAPGLVREHELITTDSPSCGL